MKGCFKCKHVSIERRIDVAYKSGNVVVFTCKYDGDAEVFITRMCGSTQIHIAQEVLQKYAEEYCSVKEKKPGPNKLKTKMKEEYWMPK